MRFYTAHLHPSRAPVLVREGFSWGAALFGPLWLAAHRAWLAAILVAAAEIALGVLTHGVLRAVLVAWALWLLGLLGQDLRRWSLVHRGYGDAHVIAARDEPTALGRLLAARPDLVGVGVGL